MRRLKVQRSTIANAAGIAVFVALAVLWRSTILGQSPAAEQKSDPPKAWIRVGDVPSKDRNPAEYDQYRKTQAARLKSPAVLQAALRAPGVSELPVLKNEREPMNWLVDHLNVISPLESELILVSLPGVDRKEAAKIVNAVTDAFLENVMDGERTNLLRQQELLAAALKEKDTKLFEKRSELQKFESQTAEAAGDVQFIRERYANSLRLATNVRERRLDNQLQAAAAKARLAAQANSNSPEAVQAKLDLSIAEAKGEILRRTSEELAHELEACVKDSQAAVTVPAARQAVRADLAAIEERRREIAAELDRASLKLNLPPRINLLERASE